MSTSGLGPQPARTDRPRSAALRVLRSLAASPEPLTIAALTAELGGHPNTVRIQVEHLVEGGFAAEVNLPSSGRGRPARFYSATVSGRQVAVEDADRGEHSALVEAVAEQLAAGREPVTQAEALGRRWGRKLGQGRTGRRGLIEALAGQGFTPTAIEDGIALLTCPLLAAAQQRPDVVCAIHQGLIDALSPEPMRLLPFAAPGACLVRPCATG